MSRTGRRGEPTCQRLAAPGKKFPRRRLFPDAVRPSGIISVGGANPHRPSQPGAPEGTKSGAGAALAIDPPHSILIDGRQLEVRCFVAALRQKSPPQRSRKYQIKSRAPRSSRKPRAACHSWFFLYWVNEKAPEVPPANFAGRKRGRNRGTTSAYSSKTEP